MDSSFSWLHGLARFPLLPSAQEEEDEEDEGLDERFRETPKEKEEKKTDHDVASDDVVKVTRDRNVVMSVHIAFNLQSLLTFATVQDVR